jgi:site-specific recombinase XerD
VIPIAPHLQAFFTERLARQRSASPHTIAAYRDAFSLFLRFAEARLGKAPSDLALDDLDAPLIGAFLDHLEKDRGNGPRTRNARLAALRSFFRHLAPRVPERAEAIQRVLAIPQKRFDRNLVDFLTRAEIAALLGAPDRSTPTGRRDHCLLLLAVQTGLRVSEITGLRIGQVELRPVAHVRCHGKGRKERVVPLTRHAVDVVRQWLKERGGEPADFVFPSRRREPLSRDAVERLVAKHAAEAAKVCPSLAAKRVSPHVLRHTAAVQLLQAGTHQVTIALWLGHESIETTQIYLEADLTAKEAALAKLAPPGGTARRFRADDRLLAFLKDLGSCRVG